MKYITTILITIALTHVAAADKINVNGAAWDDISQALDIDPFYIEVESSVKSSSLDLVAEVFKNGQMVKSYKAGSISGDSPLPLNFKSAMFFGPSKSDPGSTNVTWTLSWDSMRATSHLKIPNEIIDLTGQAFSQAQPTIAESKKSLLFTIICDSSDGYKMFPDLQKTIESNPSATIVAVYLERE